MTTAVKEKKPFLPQRKSAAPSGAVAIRTGGAATSPRGAAGGAITVGGEPRVHLLPADVTARKRFKEVRRRLVSAAIVVAVLVLVGYGYVTYTLATAQSALTSAQASTAAILTQQSKYGEVTKIKADAASIQAGQKTATAQEILWAPFVSAFQATLPAGGSILALTPNIDTPFSSAVTPDAIPLQGPHIATVAATVVMPQGDVPVWLNTLPKLKGFVDVTPGSVSSAGGGLYNVVVTLHLDGKAISGRFTKTTGSTK
jgi:hypothetical protein